MRHRRRRPAPLTADERARLAAELIAGAVTATLHDRNLTDLTESGVALAKCTTELFPRLAPELDDDDLETMTAVAVLVGTASSWLAELLAVLGDAVDDTPANLHAAFLAGMWERGPTTPNPEG